jgi:hypothetical protein
MTATYKKIATTTLGSATATVTFSSISGSYTDLVIVFRGNNTSAGNRAGTFILNSDTGSNYSATFIQGDGSSATSNRETSGSIQYFANVLNDNTNAIMQFQNYSNTTTYKTFLSRGNSSSTVVQARVGLWRSTSAITSITFGLNADDYATGSTFTLYGIKAE